MTVQTILFKRNKWSLKACNQNLKINEINYLSFRITDNYYSFRLINLSYKNYIYRIERKNKGDHNIDFVSKFKKSFII